MTDPVVPTTGPLFDGDDGLFRAALKGVSRYGEYGVGASTLWVDREGQAQIVAVETDADWHARTVAALTREGHALHHIDVGPTGKWGRPRSYRKRRNFRRYAEAIWTGPDKPQAVLIDGRFRVACFLTSLVHADPGTRIIFDDYANRRIYHIVEELLAPVEKGPRQALFVTEQTPDREAVLSLRDQFLMVMD